MREVLEQRGAIFFHEVVAASGLLTTQVEQALAELAGLGMVTSDGFSGLRALNTPSSKRKPLAGGRRRHRTVPFGIESAGRWSLLRDGSDVPGQERVELIARALLRRYGVVFRRIPAREPAVVARADPGLPAARGARRDPRRPLRERHVGRAVRAPRGGEPAAGDPETGGRGSLVALGAAVPLNFTGILTPGERIAAVGRSRILYRDGVPVLALEGGHAKSLVPGEEEASPELVQALVRKRLTPPMQANLGMAGVPAESAVPRRPASRRRTRKAAAKES